MFELNKGLMQTGCTIRRPAGVSDWKVLFLFLFLFCTCFCSWLVLLPLFSCCAFLLRLDQGHPPPLPPSPPTTSSSSSSSSSSSNSCSCSCSSRRRSSSSKRSGSSKSSKWDMVSTSENNCKNGYRLVSVGVSVRMVRELPLTICFVLSKKVN